MAVVAITQERAAGGTRVAATPDSVKKLVAMGLKVRVETGAGASIPDSEYEAAGATIAKTTAAKSPAKAAPKPAGKA